MNKRILVAVIALVVVIGGPVAALAMISLASQDTAPQSSPTTAAPAPTEEPGEDPEEALAPGLYTDYVEGAIPAETGRTFLFFYASWCGQCRDIDAGIRAQGVPDGVTIFKVDFDTEQELEAQYGVTMRTTFLEIDEGGTELQRFVAYDTPTFDAVIAAMF